MKEIRNMHKVTNTKIQEVDIYHSGVSKAKISYLYHSSQQELFSTKAYWAHFRRIFFYFSRINAKLSRNNAKLSQINA